MVEHSQLLASLGGYRFTAQGISARSLQGDQHPSLALSGTRLWRGRGRGDKDRSSKVKMLQGEVLDPRGLAV